MYEAFFGFARRPFPAAPERTHYFPAATIESARQNLARCLRRGEGAALLVGPTGTGKTLLGLVLAEEFRDIFQVAFLAGGRLSSRRALLQAILHALGLPYRGMEDGELRLTLTDHLLTQGQSRTLLLLIDEAHLLPLRLLEEVRALTNMAISGQPCVRLLVTGSAELEERLSSPHLDSFSQRVVARSYLEPFSRVETENYIGAELAGAGVAADAVFDAEARRAVHQATDGIPRLVNQVCDHALMLACVAGQHQVSAARVTEAWSDLQQLPPPWNAERPEARAAGPQGVVEFGRLEDDPAETTVAEPVSATLEANATARLDAIEQGLACVAADYEPLGTIGPEMELVFDDTLELFNEAYAEEEVLHDRLSADQQEERRAPIWPARALPRPARLAAPTRGDANVSAVADMPVEPLTLGSFTEVVEFVDTLACAESLGVRLDHVAPAAAGLPASMVVALHDVPPGLSFAFEPPGEPEPASEPAAASADLRSTGECGMDAEAEPSTFMLLHPAAAEPRDLADQEGDGDIIIIENGFDEVPPPVVHPAAPVRRREYRRLFADLRRRQQ